MSLRPDPALASRSIRLDKLQTNILRTLYLQSERRHALSKLARDVFPGASAYRDPELVGFVLPRLRRMHSLDFVRLEREGPELAASISLKGIEFVEQYAS